MYEHLQVNCKAILRAISCNSIAHKCSQFDLVFVFNVDVIATLGTCAAPRRRRRRRTFEKGSKLLYKLIVFISMLAYMPFQDLFLFGSPGLIRCNHKLTRFFYNIFLFSSPVPVFVIKDPLPQANWAESLHVGSVPMIIFFFTFYAADRTYAIPRYISSQRDYSLRYVSTRFMVALGSQKKSVHLQCKKQHPVYNLQLGTVLILNHNKFRIPD